LPLIFIDCFSICQSNRWRTANFNAAISEKPRVAALANLFGYDLDLLADPDTNTFPEFFTVYGHSAAPRTSAVAPQVAAGLTQAE
jgi:hypothetical protein